jgi:replicative DNA helicase
MTDAAHSLIDKLTAPETENLLLDWPVRAITDAIGRMRNEYIWIVAQPSIGKTAFVLAILSHLAQQGHKVSLASLESDAESIAGRLISSTAPMSTLNLRQGKATPEEIAQAREAADKISDNIMVTDGAMTVDAAVAWGKAQVRAGSRLLVFDNTRYLEVRGESNRVERMAIMSTRLKRLRDQTGVPILVLHHSTMDEKTGKDRSSWSSDPERDCDVMIFLRDNEENSKRPCAENPSGESCVNFDIAKHREGRKLVRVMLRFDKDTQRFSRWVDKEWTEPEQFNGNKSDSIFDAPM